VLTDYYYNSPQMNICEGQGKFVIEAIPDEILEEGEKK
jgi:hypothetical protein